MNSNELNSGNIEIFIDRCTYPTNFFKVSPVASKVDELLVEEPGELQVQRGVMGNLAGQHDALAHSYIQVTGWTGDDSRLWTQEASS